MAMKFDVVREVTETLELDEDQAWSVGRDAIADVELMFLPPEGEEPTISVYLDPFKWGDDLEKDIPLRDFIRGQLINSYGRTDRSGTGRLTDEFGFSIDEAGCRLLIMLREAYNRWAEIEGKAHC